MCWALCRIKTLCFIWKGKRENGLSSPTLDIWTKEFKYPAKIEINPEYCEFFKWWKYLVLIASNCCWIASNNYVDCTRYQTQVSVHTVKLLFLISFSNCGMLDLSYSVLKCLCLGKLPAFHPESQLTHFELDQRKRHTSRRSSTEGKLVYCDSSMRSGRAHQCTSIPLGWDRQIELILLPLDWTKDVFDRSLFQNCFAILVSVDMRLFFDWTYHIPSYLMSWLDSELICWKSCLLCRGILLWHPIWWL